ncbi:PAS domain S-box protein [Domibacillus sp. 8LH]|uniref:PAS domain S-box protein n=1 Tax=Domibacillus sp. 8LH TaxID=3073900 RepID=UPI003179BE66
MFFQEVLDQLSDMLFIVEIEERTVLRYVFANQSGCKRLGLSPKQIAGKTIGEVFHDQPERKAMISEQYKRVIEKRESVMYRDQFPGPDGETVHSETRLDPLFNERGELAHIVAVVRDITKSVRQQEELIRKNDRLQEAEHHWQSLIENNTDGVLFINKERELIHVNQVFRNMLGISSDLEVRDLREIMTQAFGPKELEKIYSLRRLVLQGRSQEYESYFFRQDGCQIDLQVKEVPVIIKGEIQGLYAFVKDITEQKRVEKELRESEERYRSLVDHHQDAVWSLDLEGNFTSVNPAFEKIIGRSLEIAEKPNLRDFEEEFVTPFEDVLQRYEEAKQGKSVEYNVSLYRLNKEVIHLSFTNVPIYVEGKIIGVYGIGKDVTEEVNAKKALHESEKQYRLIAENMNDLIAVFNLEGIITYASPSYQPVLGVKPEEYVGQPAISLIHEDDQPEIVSRFAEAVEHQRPYKVEFRKKGRLGEWLYFETVCMPLWNEQNLLEGFVGISRNINERKYYEEKLEHMAFYDPLTDVPNRRLFEKLANHAMKEAARSKQKASIMYLDLDKFKFINDTLGHDVGDELLMQFTDRLKGSLRKMDVLARMGGDEFTVLLPNTDRTAAEEVAGRLLQAIGQPYQVKGHLFTTTSSIGIAFYPQHGQTVEELIQQADEAMYRAKQGGGNDFILAD